MFDKVKKILSKYLWWFSLSKTSFREQLILSVAVCIILMTFLTTIAISTLTNKTLYERFLEEGRRITKVFAEQSILALLYYSPDNAQDIVKAVLAFPDVQGVALYDLNYQILLKSDNMVEPPEIQRKWPAELNVDYETDDHWYFVSPVHAGRNTADDIDSPFIDVEAKQELLGYVRVLLSKYTLNAMTENLQQRNLLVSSILTFILLSFLLLITSRMIKPLKNLADIMRRADQGEYYIRAEVTGPKDIKDMEHAFNTMMEALEARDEELTRTRDAALESARIKGEFAANVTHELRTPMNGVLGMLELLHETNLSTKQREYVQVARNSAESLLLLIDDILDFSKMDAGKASLKITDFDLREMIHEILELLNNQARRKELYLNYFMSEQIPVFIKSAPERIRQILINLIGNAIKFTDEGGISIKVSTLSYENDQDEQPQVLQFEVIDTGIGISLASQQEIFNAFSQVDGSSARKHSGTGLGLAISKQLVSLLNGKIGVESAPGKGSRFWFLVPFLKADVEMISPKPDDKTLAEGSQRISSDKTSSSKFLLKTGGHILLVEDNITNQQVAVGLLEHLGHTITVASSGWEALDLFGKEHFDVILMDIQMPGMDGYEVTERIREREKSEGRQNIPIIAMTANNQQREVDRCFATGMDDFIGKPFKLYMVEEKLRFWLKNKYSDPNKQTLKLTDLNLDDTDTAYQASNENTLNTEVLEELHKNVGDVLIRMIQVYLEDMPGLIEDLQKNFHAGELKDAERQAHTLKSSGKTFGALHFADLCKRMEDSLYKEDTQAAGGLLGTIVNESQSVKEALQTVLANLTEDNKQQPGQAIILVVDDQRDMRLMIRSMLEIDGYNVVEAESGEQALELCTGDMPDLVIMDAVMPGIDGFAACRNILMLPGGEQTPVLIATALEDVHTIEQAFSAGAVDYIPKPINFKVLRKRISRLLDASSAEKNVRHLVYNDVLTNLLNRTAFMRKLNQLIESPRMNNQMLAVMFVDLDRFKRINESLGHEAGDLLLKKVAERLSGIVRNTDIVARMGGDEFGIILDNISAIENLAKVAEKLCKRMAEPMQFMGQRVYVTVSVGISVFPGDGSTASELVRFADTAMFKVKEKRNGFQFYESGMEKLIAQKMYMENELRNALKKNEFIMYYQPQMELGTGRISGMEALIRWQHPKRGMVPPLEFILLAEETGLIIELGEWVLRHTCMQIREWLDKGYTPLQFAVNLSGRQFEDGHLTQKIDSILNETGVPPGLLELEITESAIMENPDAAIPILEEIKNMGISLAIDDFGTGHSSLNYLRKFPIDILKIDRSFVKDVMTSAEEAAIVKGIIALAKSLNLKVIAEGVETEEQKTFLLNSACDFIQGYYLYKPLAGDVFEKTIFRKMDKVTNF